MRKSSIIPGWRSFASRYCCIMGVDMSDERFSVSITGENPDVEVRNPKQVRITNSPQKHAARRIGTCGDCLLGFVSDFERRISDLRGATALTEEPIDCD